MGKIKKFQEQYIIRSSEVAPSGEAKLQAIGDLLQETAGNHARQLNFDIAQLRRRKLTWMLHRLHIKMDKFPEWRDQITVQTWPSSGDALRAYRDFIILDSDGQELGRCLSYWLMINMENRRPVRMPEEVLDMAPRDVDHVLKVQKNRIDFDSEPVESKIFTVRRSDLDINRHVNNVKYMEWALEVLPADKSIYELDIEFLSECTVGEEIKSEYANSEKKEEYSHRLCRVSDNKVAAHAVSRSR